MLIPIKELIESSTGANGYVGDEIKNFIRNEKISGSKMDFEQRLKNLKERRLGIQAELDWNKTMSNSYDPYNRNKENTITKDNPTTNVTSKKILPKDQNNPYNQQTTRPKPKLNIKA